MTPHLAHGPSRCYSRLRPGVQLVEYKQDDMITSKLSIKNFLARNASRRTTLILFTVIGLSACSAATYPPGNGDKGAVDPGVRDGSPGAGGPLAGLDPVTELPMFQQGKIEFSVPEGVDEGLGPRFNGESCAQCHAQPAVGGSSPRLNPQVEAATTLGARNTVPPFILPNGPVREARFKFKPD